jgi:hypothetical protein
VINNIYVNNNQKESKSMKELIQMLQEKLGSDVLTEELASDLSAQVEVAINEKVQTLIEAKEAELEEKNAEEVTEFKESLISSIDQYIEYAADEYLKENEVAIEAGSKVATAEKIIEATKLVFAEVGLEIPVEEVDHVKAMEEQVENTNNTINEKVQEILELNAQAFEFEKAVSFMKKTTALAESQISEVHDLMEGLEYKDVADFEKKVDIVLEKVIKVVVKEEEENFENLEEEELEEEVSSIDKYL